jgi:hypothetical protein
VGTAECTRTIRSVSFCWPHRLPVAVGHALVMKNWEPLVLGPALAIESSPGRVCLTLNCAGQAGQSVSQSMRRP